MKSFKNFLNEASVPVISIDKLNVDIALEETRNEINKNLRQVTAGGFVNPYMGYVKVAKILANYGVTLPQIIFRDAIMGEEIFEVGQFGKISGMTRDKPLNAATGNYVTYQEKGDQNLYYLHFEYEQNEKGIFEVKASIKDQKTIRESLEEF